MARRLPMIWLLALLLVSGPGAARSLDWPDWVSNLGHGGDDRVLVFLVGHRERVARVRASVDPDRIVVETPDAIALREGRIVAVDVDSVPGPFTQAGWMDREIEIMHLSRVEWWRGQPGARKREQGAKARRSDAERMAHIQALLEKGSLNVGEQLFLLQAMNDGLVF